MPRPAEVNQVLRFFCGAHDGSHLCENMGTGERKIRLVTTSGKNGNNSARKAGTERGREEGVSEDRFQAKQTNSLRARGPRGLEFRCGPAPEAQCFPVRRMPKTRRLNNVSSIRSRANHV